MSLILPMHRHKSDDRIEYTASADVTAGTPIEVFTGLVGVPVNDIANGETDELDITGRFLAKGKAAQAWTAGAAIGWDESAEEFTSTGGDQDFVVGKAAKDKAAGELYGVILLNA